MKAKNKNKNKKKSQHTSIYFLVILYTLHNIYFKETINLKENRNRKVYLIEKAVTMNYDPKRK
jgi:hypothetical protein